MAPAHLANILALCKRCSVSSGLAHEHLSILFVLNCRMLGVVLLVFSSSFWARGIKRAWKSPKLQSLLLKYLTPQVSYCQANKLTPKLHQKAKALIWIISFIACSQIRNMQNQSHTQVTSRSSPLASSADNESSNWFSLIWTLFIVSLFLIVTKASEAVLNKIGHGRQF